MKPAISVFPIFLLCAQLAVAASVEEVASNERLWTGVAVSQSGRMFVNFPRWSTDVPTSVAELDENGEARVTLTVTRQPGNNYRAAASVIGDVFGGSDPQVDQTDADAKQYDMAAAGAATRFPPSGARC